LWIKRFSKKFYIIPFLFLLVQLHSKTAQGHIGDGEKARKSNAEAASQFTTIVFFENGLQGWQKGPPWIVDKTKRQIRIGTISQGIQPFDRLDAFLIDSFTPLSAYILFEVAWHGGDQSNFMVSEKLGYLLHAWFKKYSQVRSHLDLVFFLPKGFNKTAKMWIELWRSARQIDQLSLGAPRSLQDQLHGRPLHDLCPVWRCFEVAVDASLITPQPQVDLQDFDSQAMQSVTLRVGNLFFKIVHRSSPMPTPQLHQFRGQVGFQTLVSKSACSSRFCCS
jgi:hypothetical protein